MPDTDPPHGGKPDGDGEPKTPGQGEAPSLDSIAELISNKISEAFGDPLNRAINSHVKRLGSDLEAKFSPKPDPEPTPEPKPAGKKGSHSEVDALKLKVERLEQERETERVGKLKAERNSDLRAALTRANVPDVDAAYLYFKGLEATDRLLVNDEGRYYAEDAHGSHQDLETFVQGTVKGNQGLQSGTGREGSGGTETPARGGNRSLSTMTKEQYKAAYNEARDKGPGEADLLMLRVTSGEITIEG